MEKKRETVHNNPEYPTANELSKRGGTAVKCGAVALAAAAVIGCSALSGCDDNLALSGDVQVAPGYDDLQIMGDMQVASDSDDFSVDGVSGSDCVTPEIPS